jgi:beta-1,4-mannosyl-glycoprotein beta-1,4-N-acetylglucosaminyltransferase
MPEVWDCFMFNDEIDMLRFRIEELDPVVDRFVIVESPITHMGLPKPLVAAESLSLLGSYAHKMELVVAELDSDAPSAWHRENEHRAALRNHIKDGSPDDVLIIGDVDEIPHREILARLRERQVSPVRLGLQNSLFFANWVMKTEWLFGPIACRRSQIYEPMLRELLYDAAPDPERLKQTEPAIGSAGHHLYNLGGVDRLRNKLSSFTPHQEFNTAENQKIGHLERCVQLGVHFTGTDVVRRLQRDELDGMLERLHSHHPEWFNFTPAPDGWQVRTWAGYTWLRSQPSMPKRLVSYLDQRPWMVRGPIGPAVLAADTARRAWGRFNRKRTWKKTIHVDL